MFNTREKLVEIVTNVLPEEDRSDFGVSARLFVDYLIENGVTVKQGSGSEPLTLEDLRELDAPVWCVCKPIEGGNGYWCLCKNGTIITPAGSVYDVAEIPHWTFLRRKPMED